MWTLIFLDGFELEEYLVKNCSFVIIYHMHHSLLHSRSYTLYHSSHSTIVIYFSSNLPMLSVGVGFVFWFMLMSMIFI